LNKHINLSPSLSITIQVYLLPLTEPPHHHQLFPNCSMPGPVCRCPTSPDRARAACCSGLRRRHIPSPGSSAAARSDSKPARLFAHVHAHACVRASAFVYAHVPAINVHDASIASHFREAHFACSKTACLTPSLSSPWDKDRDSRMAEGGGGDLGLALVLLDELYPLLLLGLHRVAHKVVLARAIPTRRDGEATADHVRSRAPPASSHSVRVAPKHAQRLVPRHLQPSLREREEEKRERGRWDMVAGLRCASIKKQT
jgi:hypothetical protein